MENKCLVTRLGNSVSGDFPVLGEVKIKVTTVGLTPTSGYSLSGTGVTVDLTGTLAFNTDYSHTDHSGTLLGDKTGELVISNKYSLQYCSFGNSQTMDFVEPIDIKDLTYYKDITQLLVPGRTGYERVKGNISCLANKPLTGGLRLDNNKVEGDITVFAYAYAKAVKDSLTMNTFNCQHNPLITGSIEELVAAIRVIQTADGDTASSGGSSFDCQFADTGVTFIRNAIPTNTEQKLSWTATTITYNGTTITA